MRRKSDVPGCHHSSIAGGVIPAARPDVAALVVDDQEHARIYMRMVLRSLGLATVWEAGNGREALELFARHRPALVLLDNNMPFLSGKEAIDKIRAIDPGVAIVVVTAENDGETVRYYLDHGANAYVLKHSPRSMVTAMIEEVLNGIAAQAG